MDGDGENTDSAVLARTWRHSHEEDDADLLVFRPSGHDLPPARGRRGFTLSTDGTMQMLGVARDDRRTFAPGRWAVEGETLTLQGPKGKETYQIVSADEGRLVLRRS